MIRDERREKEPSSEAPRELEERHAVSLVTLSLSSSLPFLTSAYAPDRNETVKGRDNDRKEL